MKHPLTLASVSALVAVFALVTPDRSHSQARVDVSVLTCSQAKSYIDRQGAAVVATGPRTYDRFVKGRRFCPIGDRAKRQTVRTSDRRSCFIGFVCALPRSAGGS